MASLWALIKKDLIQEWRSKDIISAMLAFAVLTLFIFNYALSLSPQAQASIATGIVWVLVVFAGTLASTAVFQLSKDQGCLMRSCWARPDFPLVYLAKMLKQFFDYGTFGAPSYCPFNRPALQFFSVMGFL